MQLPVLVMELQHMFVVANLLIPLVPGLIDIQPYTHRRQVVENAQIADDDLQVPNCGFRWHGDFHLGGVIPRIGVVDQLHLKRCRAFAPVRVFSAL